MDLSKIELERIDGTKESMEKYLGNILLIVNTASKCGFTPQYEALEALYKKYHEKGFEILGFPCNQFKEQEPEDESKIAEFCKMNYGVTFPLFSKIDVKGENMHPLYRFLTEKKEFQGFDEGHPLSGKLHEIISAEEPDYKNSSDIKWNFTKFLINRDGTVIDRFEPTADMERVEHALEDLFPEKEV
ncbi:glutathione peroxidase [Muricomes sp. OA1]|uniref:Glutathione peroxidase n=1 Tax=Hungatella hathewayi TaxID=154046 RepID=A0A3E2WXX2_9FIRM|nr:MULTISPECIES: glutathione peroxidase [Clostridia]MCH1974579.1 glutathione peroxidase [Muricomes sp. OA1]RGC33013.1 glutathione peroxidase [Hungatella hathewayi]GKH33360.1 glutathione peroxidase [Faecalicatena contorta]